MLPTAVTAPRMPRVGALRVFLLLLGAIALLIVLPLILTFSLSTVRYLRYTREEIARSAMLSVVSAREATEMYQETITQAATLVLMDPALGEIETIRSLDDVRGSYDAYRRLDRAVSLLTSMTYIGSLRVDSAYFYMEGSDYIISSDLGAIRLSRFSDTGFRDVYDRLLENPHSSVWMARRVPVPTISGNTTELVSYVTYANFTNPIVTRVRGAILVNVRETVFSSLTNATGFDRGGHTFIVDDDGAVVSHMDPALVLESAPDGPWARLLGEQGERLAVGPTGSNGKVSLSVSAFSPKSAWTYVSVHSLDELTGRTRTLMRASMLVISVIVLVGSCGVLFLATRMSVPLRKLIGTLSQGYPGGERPRLRGANEFQFLLESFQRIREREAELHKAIGRTRDRLWESYVVDLLRGDLDKHAEPPFPESRVVTPGGQFRVLAVCPDGRTDLDLRLSQEQRHTFLSLLSAECEKAFSTPAPGVAAILDGSVVVVVDATGQGESPPDELLAVAESIQERFTVILGSTLTIGVSERHPADLTLISRAYEESREAVQRRLVRGYGKVHVSGRAPGREYRYPYEAETVLLSCLAAGDLPGAESALGTFFSGLEDMSSPDILRSTEQLCAVIVGFMRERDIRRADTGGRGVYDELAARETLWEKRALITELCRIISIETGSGGTVFLERMIDYVKSNFRTIIDFEAMADTVGISYSYMRRLMKEHTGRSILEHVHYLRMEEAGRLLGDTGRSISSIASHLGYNNLQSFERFFRKHKGVAAHEYRRLLQTGTLGRP